MAKPTVAQAESDAQVIPLSDVTITGYRQAYFVSGEEQAPFTVSGRQLGQIMAWLVKTRPGWNMATDDDLWPALDIAIDLEALGEVLRGLGNTDPDEIEMPGVFSLLGDIAGDLAARLHASEGGDSALKRATLTFPTRKAVAS